VAATALTFAFVAIWHDAEAKLVAWGALNAVFLALESFVTVEWQRRTGHLAAEWPWVHRQIGVLAGSTCIMVMMALNMIGYSVGVGGISRLLATASAAGAEAAWVVFGALAVLFAGTQVMLELRKIDGTFARGRPHGTETLPEAATAEEQTGTGPPKKRA